MSPEFTSWRNFDLTSRITKLRNAFDCLPVTTASDVPIVFNTPCYFSFGSLDIPVSMLTTEGQDEDRDKAMALGATAYIVKPFKPTQLLSLLEEIL